LLRSPEHALQFEIPSGKESGGVCAAYRVVHNTWLGPADFDIRLDPSLTAEDVMARAMCRTWQYGILDLPFGGAADGIAINPLRLSAAELERVHKNYAGEALRSLGNEEASCAALPPSTAGRNGARARGLHEIANAACEHLGFPLSGARVAIQGFGSFGSLAAVLIGAEGARIVSVSDTRGAIFNSKGLDLEKLIAHKARSGSVAGFAGAEPVTESELLSLDCDILIGAASENTIRRQNAPLVRARIVAEAAEGCMTAEAAAVLDRNEAFVLPGLLCNAGAAAAGYFEWLRSSRGLLRDEQDDSLRAAHATAGAFSEALKVSISYNVPLRNAAYILGISRVADGLKRAKDPARETARLSAPAGRS
jgi:glutamate dehydrogenase/leucine dehydrogenase